MGALCLAHTLVDLDEARILAIVHDTAVPNGIEAVSVINEWYGRSNILLGAYRGPIGAPNGSAEPVWAHNGEGVYIADLLARSPSASRNASPVLPALKVYHKTLAAAPDGSVTIVGIGFATNLLELLQSLGGAALVASKVNKLVYMGGRRNMFSQDRMRTS